MRKFIVGLMLALMTVNPAVAQSGPKFGKNGGVGSSSSTFNDGEPTGGTYSVNGTTGAARLKSVVVDGPVTSTSATVSGAATANSLTVSGAASAATLALTGQASAASLVVSGAATLNSLSVSGAATTGSMSVTGTATADGIVANTSIVGNSAPLTLNGPAGFWTNTNSFPNTTNTTGIIHKITGRIQVGYATAESGDFCFPARTGCASVGSTTKSWYETLETVTSPYGFRDSWAQVSVGAKNGGIGVLGYARSSDVTDVALGGLQLGLGGWFAGYNDNTTIQQHVGGVYAVGIRAAGAGQDTPGSGTIGAEFDIVNLGGLSAVNPGNIYPTTGFTTALQVNSGGSYPAAQVASAGITMGNNRAQFNAGIVVANNTLQGINLDGTGKPVSGGGSFARLPAFAQLEWWTYPWSAPSFTVVSQQLTPGNAQSVIAKDTGIEIGGPANAGLAFATQYPGGATGAWFVATPAFGSTSPTLSVEGQTNSDLRISPKGTGSVVIPIAKVLNAANDAAAAALGVSVGGIYRNGSVVMIRVN